MSVKLPNKVIKTACGFGHSMVLLSDGTVYEFGLG